MIPSAHIQQWAATTPWPDPRQVEQDLIICRALCDIFNDPFLADRLAFRGGTAIHKLLFRHPLRYSEDIDLVQVRPEPIGHTVDAVRRALSWLGPCRRKAAAHSLHLVFSFVPESAPTTTAKLKVEINTREHENLYGIRAYPFAVENPWFGGKVSIASFEPEELFGTKLRALLQRRKGRDLFDLHEGLKELSLDSTKVIGAFTHYRRDRRKDQLLQENDYLVLRFLAEDVGKDLDLVLDAILRALSHRRPAVPTTETLRILRRGQA